MHKFFKDVLTPKPWMNKPKIIKDSLFADKNVKYGDSLEHRDDIRDPKYNLQFSVTIAVILEVLPGEPTNDLTRPEDPHNYK